jgi:methylthioribose-1-phosphate isomerase
MSLTAHQVSTLPVEQARARMHEAGAAIGAARPTNAHPREAVTRVLSAITSAATTSELVEAALTAAEVGLTHYADLSDSLARATVALLPDGARIMTHCWMDAYLFAVVRAAEQAGRRYEWVVTETRPYLQGARLTAHSLRELDQSVTLITDGMGAAAMQPGSSIGTIDALVTAADRVSMDGAVINKVGTLGLAVAATAFGVPYYALVQEPDESATSAADIVIEQRRPEEVLETLGVRTASPLVTDAWYPAFDVTPARFVTRIVTSRGDFAPDRIADHFAGASA